MLCSKTCTWNFQPGLLTSMGKHSRLNMSKNKDEIHHRQSYTCIFCPHAPICLRLIPTDDTRVALYSFPIDQTSLGCLKEVWEIQGMFQGQHWMHHFSVSHWPWMHPQQSWYNHPLVCLQPAAFCTSGPKLSCCSQRYWEEKVCGSAAQNYWHLFT